MFDFDLTEALFLTYTGLASAFIALGLLILLILGIRLLEHWQRRRSGTNMADQEASELRPAPLESDLSERSRDAELVAAIAAALVVAHRSRMASETNANLASLGGASAAGQTWRNQGRLDAFEARRLWRSRR